MKYLKILVIALVTLFTFEGAKAQVVVRAGVQVGGPYYWHGRHYHHRTPYMRHHHRYYRYY
jgi:hypothetical protein